MQNIDSMLDRAGHWFLRSGIQEPSGGVARYYRSDVGKNARVSTEITGYAVSTLLFLAERTGDVDYTEAAVRAARFLTDTAWSRAFGTFPFEHSDNCEPPRPLAYFFDCGIIVRGLLEAWRANGDRSFLDAGVAAGRAMIADFGALESLHPILELPSKRPLEYGAKWSTAPGCYQLKSAMAWFDLFEATGDENFNCAYGRALEAALGSENSFLPGDADCEKVMDRLHAYCYFLEGLLPCAHRPEVARTLAAGIAKTSRYLCEIAPQFARSDVYAQLLRVRLYAAHAGAVPLDETAASFEAARAGEFQLTSGDPRIEGGFAFGRKGAEILPFVNPVSTGFCVQALALWREHEDGALNPALHALI